LSFFWKIAAAALAKCSSMRGITHKKHQLVDKRRGDSSMPEMSDLEFGELLKAFEEVLRKDRHNDEPAGCLDRSELVALAGAPGNGISIRKAALNHIGRCWPCLRKLKALRARKCKTTGSSE